MFAVLTKLNKKAPLFAIPSKPLFCHLDQRGEISPCATLSRDDKGRRSLDYDDYVDLCHDSAMCEQAHIALAAPSVRDDIAFIEV